MDQGLLILSNDAFVDDPLAQECGIGVDESNDGDRHHKAGHPAPVWSSLAEDAQQRAAVELRGKFLFFKIQI